MIFTEWNARLSATFLAKFAMSTTWSTFLTSFSTLDWIVEQDCTSDGICYTITRISWYPDTIESLLLSLNFWMTSVNSFTTSVESKAQCSMSLMSSSINPLVNPSKNFKKFYALSLTRISLRTNLEEAYERKAVAIIRRINVLFILNLCFLTIFNNIIIIILYRL